MALFTALAGIALAGTQIAQGLAANREAKYNASIFGKQAEMITAQQGLEGYQYDRAMAKMSGGLTARVAKAGLMMSGSPMAVMIDNQTQMELDKSIGQYNLEVQKRVALSQAEAYKKKGRNAVISGFSNAFSTLLTTGAGGAFGSGFDSNYTADIAGLGKVKVAPPNYYLRATLP